jgi:predicted NBD/HSP70 family sugar kinase
VIAATSLRTAPGTTSAAIRRANLGRVLGEIHRRGVVSRSELGALTGLTRSSILALVGALVDAGLVAERRASPDGTPGRPSPFVRPVPAAAVTLAMEIAVDWLTVATVGLGGTVIERVRAEQPRGRPADDTLAVLSSLGNDILARLAPGTRLVGISVAVAGQVSRRDGHVSLAPNLGWRDVPMGEQLAELFAVDVPLEVANEAQLGAIAEHRRGAAIGVSDVVFVVGDVGVGGGLIVGGQPFSGATGTAGEMGHLIVDPGGRPCRCGSRGCWETVVSEEALLERAGLPVDGGRMGAERVIAQARAGDVTCRRAMLETAHWLATGLVGLVNVLNPQLVVLGGYFASASSVWGDALFEQVRAAVLPVSRSDLRIVPAQLGTDAALLGAAELAFEHLLADPLP